MIIQVTTHWKRSNIPNLLHWLTYISHEASYIPNTPSMLSDYTVKVMGQLIKAYTGNQLHHKAFIYISCITLGQNSNLCLAH